jgi:hypothetical protein
MPAFWTAYRAYADRLDVILDPNIPDDARRALLALVQKVRDKEIAPEQARVEAAKISPKAARFFEFDGLSADGRAALLGAALCVGATLMSPFLSAALQKPPVVIINQNPPQPVEQQRLHGDHRAPHSAAASRPQSASEAAEIVQPGPYVGRSRN